MPELPEVETVRRGLAPVVEGAIISRVELRRPDLRFPFPKGMRQALQGSRVEALARRAKYLLFHLDSGKVLVSHLGMSGSYRISAGGQPGNFHHERSRNEAHDHVVFTLSRSGEQHELIYNDPRRFGFMLLLDAASLNEHPAFARLGVEPTGNVLDGAYLAQRFAGRRTPLKSALMDQRNIAGLGNIYVCEALWRARLDPQRPAGSIAPDGSDPQGHCARLAEAIREVIAEAIAAGGSTLRDFVHADGTLGYFQHGFSVYDREGDACPRPQCGVTIARLVQSGRSTFHCPACQN